ncbi:PqiC family protein [Thioalkalivibrio paradoxus]|uniref:ABC-type transport auxiliary lipoprotein component domain-containing protein n=1 Tax=Thioalkalivibrio paradoxus ARh 1 TaxID=713585 RepID=W0DNZ5_9GAMM|nr:ABC-type transport auxiliary lipoprotein family protein [Thioalkalivibrio paradoxus]AHF00157.1 hypothetical protein THITH_10685 [Thioalkalivibrio paradoxus ARh 1]
MICHWFRPAAILWLAFAAAGCTLLPEQPAVDRAWFLLEIPDPAAVERPPVPVELGSVRIAPAVAGKGLVYRLGPYRYESDFYNEWFLSPREHFEQILRERWTRTDGSVNLVTDARSHPGSLQIDVLITALHGDLGAGGTGAARAGLRVFVQGRTDSRLWDLEQTVDLATRSPEALVAALSSAMGELLAELEDRLARQAGG